MIRFHFKDVATVNPHACLRIFDLVYTKKVTRVVRLYVSMYLRLCVCVCVPSVCIERDWDLPALALIGRLIALPLYLSVINVLFMYGLCRVYQWYLHSTPITLSTRTQHTHHQLNRNNMI